MALGDGIRRNIAHVSQIERSRFINAIVELNSRNYPDGVSKWVKQDKIHEATHVHGGPAFLPWHRELCNRFEGLLREVDPELSLHYWDWTEDPRFASNGSGGTINLFTNDFMGEANGVVQDPFVGFPPITRSVGNGNIGQTATNVDSDDDIINSTNGVPEAQQFTVIRNKIEFSPNHNSIHGYIGGTIGNGHTAFEDPFVFLLHSNVDRIWANWQNVPGQTWRLDPNRVYGDESNDNSILEDLEPWAGGSGLRPWATPDNQQIAKNSRHISVVTPPVYDTKANEFFPFENFQFFKESEGVLRIKFDYTHTVNDYDQVLVLLLEQDSVKDKWSLRPRDYYMSTPGGGIRANRLAFYNESYNDWLTIPTNTSGNRDDHGRRLFMNSLATPLGSNEVTVNAYYRPNQPDRGSTLEFYALVGIVSKANGHPVSILGDYYTTPTLNGV